MKKFSELTQQEVLALAISLEEDDAKIYDEFVDGLKESYPATAKIFEGMSAEENQHRKALANMYKQKFGEHIPLIRRQDVRGFIQRRPIWLAKPLGLDSVRSYAESMEMETRMFYEKAASRTDDVDIRGLLTDLARVEKLHAMRAQGLKDEMDESSKVSEEKTRRHHFVLQIIQPGLAGLMDGSVSTLAPVFAAALATQDSWKAFLVGMAASVGAGISMGFAEALSDDGSLTGRGHPWVRGSVCGAMTTLGGIGHTLPFLIGTYKLAVAIAFLVVVVELGVITWIRSKYMETPIMSAAVQVVLGGVLVFLTGILIGGA